MAPNPFPHWTRVPVAELELPPNCVECRSPTTNTMRIRAYRNGAISLVEAAGRYRRFLEVSIGMCPACANVHRHGNQRALLAAMIAALPTVIAVFCVMANAPVSSTAATLAIIGGVLGLIVMPMVVRSAMRLELPIAIRAYHARDASVEILCRASDPAFERMRLRALAQAGATADASGEAPDGRRRTWGRGLIFGAGAALLAPILMTGAIGDAMRHMDDTLLGALLAGSALLAGGLGVFAGTRRWVRVRAAMPRATIATRDRPAPRTTT